MRKLRSEFLLTLTIEVSESHLIGETPAGARRIDFFNGGTFEGPKLKGRILSGGSDALLRRGDEAMQPDVRLTLETDDGHLIYVSYRGIRHGPREVMQRIADGEEVDPEAYYLRNAPFFETASERYSWLNRIVAVSVGSRRAGAAVYDVHQIL